MAGHRPIRLPRQWSKHVKAGVLHAISLASVALAYARDRETGQRRLCARIEQATSEIARDVPQLDRRISYVISAL